MSEKLTYLIVAGYKARAERRVDDALALFKQAVEVGQAVTDQSLLAEALTGLGQIERDLRNNEAALRHYAEAAEIYRKLDKPQRIAHTVRHAADILRHEKRFQEAKSDYDEALSIYRSHPGTKSLDLANAIRGLALTEGELGDVPAARRLWQEARTLYEAVSVQAGVDESDEQLRRLESK
jgi:tetratricopeptide (TPR) repeat protein